MKHHGGTPPTTTTTTRISFNNDYTMDKNSRKAMVRKGIHDVAFGAEAEGEKQAQMARTEMGKSIKEAVGDR